MPSNKGMPVRSKRRPGVDTTDDMSSIATVLQNLVRDWDRRDVAAFGRAFTPSATYATGAGREARGRPAIRDLVKRAEAAVKIVGRIQVRCKGTVGTARFGWCSVERQGSGRRGTVACTLARQGKAWLVRRLTNEERWESRGNGTPDAATGAARIGDPAARVRQRLPRRRDHRSEQRSRRPDRGRRGR